MPRIKYYANEQNGLENYTKRVTDNQARYIFKRLKARYRIRQQLEFTDRVRGNCSSWRIRLEHKPEIGVIAHEIAHAIQFKKRKYGEKWHTKKHKKIMDRVYKTIETNLETWVAMADKKKERRETAIKNKQEKQQEAKEKRQETPYKLQKTLALIKKWETKKKRSENALKKLNRRRKLYETLLKRNGG